MNIKKRTSIGVVGYDIDDVNLNEMRQLATLKDEIAEVLISHRPEVKDKKYLSDTSLKLAFAVLRVFTKEYVADNKSSFDDELKLVEQEEKNMKVSPAPVDDEE